MFYFSKRLSAPVSLGTLQAGRTPDGWDSPPRTPRRSPPPTTPPHGGCSNSATLYIHKPWIPGGYVLPLPSTPSRGSFSQYFLALSPSGEPVGLKLVNPEHDDVQMNPGKRQKRTSSSPESLIECSLTLYDRIRSIPPAIGFYSIGVREDIATRDQMTRRSTLVVDHCPRMVSHLKPSDQRSHCINHLSACIRSWAYVEPFTYDLKPENLGILTDPTGTQKTVLIDLLDDRNRFNLSPSQLEEWLCEIRVGKSPITHDEWTRIIQVIDETSPRCSRPGTVKILGDLKSAIQSRLGA